MESKYIDTFKLDFGQLLRESYLKDTAQIIKYLTPHQESKLPDCVFHS